MMCCEWQRTDEKPDPWQFRRWESFTILWFCEFATFSFERVILPTQSKISPRGGQMVRSVSLGISSPCLAVSVHTWRRADASSRRTTNRRKTRPVKFQNMARLYDFTNLWFYDFRFRSSNFTRSKQDKISPRGGQMTRSAQLGFSFLVMSGCKYRYMGARRRCVAKDHEPPKTRSVEVRKMESFYDFMILRIYDFMTFASYRVILLTQNKISPCGGQMARSASLGFPSACHVWL